MDLNIKVLIISLSVSFLFLLVMAIIAKKESGTESNIAGKFKAKFLGEHNLLVRVLRWFSLILFFIFISISFARPRFGERDVEIKKVGIDAIVAIDISRSMLAEDVKPSRFKYAKMIATQILDKISNNGRLGLLVFSGDGYVLSPLTEDNDAIHEFMGELDESMTTNGGTNFYNLCRRSSEMFIGKLKSNLLIVISDGEDHSKNLDDGIKMLKDKGIKVLSIGVGTAEGSPILVYDKNGSRNYLKNRKGDIVYSKLDNSTLVKLATKTNGKYFNLNGNLLNTNKILDYVNSLKKSELKSKKIISKAEQYQIFLFIAVLNFIIFLFLFNWPKRKENL